jgi:6,7-dimethyl-8-ribityllumazine synthase
MATRIRRYEYSTGFGVAYRHSAGLIGAVVEHGTNVISWIAETKAAKLAREKAERAAKRKAARAAKKAAETAKRRQG